MINVVGIGSSGCNIARKLSDYSQYKIFEIDEGINVKKENCPEDYEKNCPTFKKLFAPLYGDTFVIVSACGDISGLTLKVLEKLKDNKTSVICLVSDQSLISNKSKLQQNIVVNVLQEYARSGLLEKIYLIENSCLEALLEDVPLDQYYDKLNEIFCYTFHSIMYFRNSKPLFETKENKSSIDRISTFALYDGKEKKMFYNFKNATKERYFYSFSKEDIKKDGKILQNIKTNLLKEEDNISKTFAIYQSQHTDRYAFVELTTHITQNIV